MKTILVDPAMFGAGESKISVVDDAGDEIASARFKNFRALDLVSLIEVAHCAHPDAIVRIDPRGIGAGIADEWEQRQAGKSK